MFVILHYRHLPLIHQPSRFTAALSTSQRTDTLKTYACWVGRGIGVTREYGLCCETVMLVRSLIHSLIYSLTLTLCQTCVFVDDERDRRESKKKSSRFLSPSVTVIMIYLQNVLVSPEQVETVFCNHLPSCFLPAWQLS